MHRPATRTLRFGIVPLAMLVVAVALLGALGASPAVAGAIYAAPGWCWTNPGPIGPTDLSDVELTDTLRGWAVGRAGCVIRTTDGGVTWERAQEPCADELTDVSAIDGDTAWVIAGSHGDRLYTTTDGGISWAPAGPAAGWGTGYSGPHYEKVDFVSESTGFVCNVSGLVYRTTDGGGAWSSPRPTQPYFDPQASLRVCDMEFVDQDRGLMLAQVECIDWFTEGFSWVAVVVFETTDGGVTWTPNELWRRGFWGTFLDIEWEPLDLDVLPSGRAVVTRHGWRACHVRDVWGGAWRLTNLTGSGDYAGSNQHPPLGGATLLDGDGLVYVGNYPFGNAYPFGSASAFVSGDSGVSWSETPLGGRYSAVDYVAGGSVVAVGEGGVAVSTDRGVSWSLPPGDVRSTIEAIDVAPDGAVWALPDYYLNRSADGSALRSTDGGATWTRTAVVCRYPAFASSVAALDRQTAWASFDALPQQGFHLLRTTDGGSSWTWVEPARDRDRDEWMYSRRLVFATPDSGWVLARSTYHPERDYVARTTDGGSSWTVSMPLPLDQADDLCLQGETGIVWVCGYLGRPGEPLTGALARSTWDNAWTRVSCSRDNTWLNDVAFTDSSTGWAVGGVVRAPQSAAVILRTTDGGGTWIEAYETGFDELVGVAFADKTRGWAITSSGGVIGTTDGGATWTTEAELLAEDLTAIDTTTEGEPIVCGTDGAIALRDVTHPITTVTGETEGWQGWLSSSVDLTFDATDNLSGVERTEYRLDGSAWTQGSAVTVPAPADHSGDGLHTVEYRSVDRARNVEETRSVAVGIDTRAPVATCSDDGSWHARGPLLSLAGSDELSGVARVEYKLGWFAGWRTGDSVRVPPISALWPLSVRCVDRAGNVSGVLKTVVRVDTTAPWTQALWPVIVRKGRTARVVVRVCDNLSPTCEVAIEVTTATGDVAKRLELGPLKRYWWHEASFTADLPRGTYRYRVLARDLAGNDAVVVGENRLMVR